MDATVGPGRPRHGQYPRVEEVLWAVLVAAAAADAATTAEGLARGLPEANPAVAAFVAAGGPPSLVVAKALYLAAAYAVWRLVEPGTGRVAVLAVPVAVELAVVANNLYWLTVYG